MAVSTVILWLWFANAQTTVDTGFADAVNSGSNVVVDIKQLRVDYKPELASCDNLYTYVYNLAKNLKTYNPWIMYAREESAISMDVSSSMVKSTPSSANAAWLWNYSDVNSQVNGVQESDILRSNGKYMFYNNYKLGYIQIIKIPVANEKPQIINNIQLPKWFTNAVLQLYANKLVILTSRYQDNYVYSESNAVDNSTVTYAATYDISDINNIKFEKLFSYDGYMLENRVIDNKLYLLTSKGISYERLNSLKTKIDSGTDVKSEIMNQLSGYCNDIYISSGSSSANIVTMIDLDLSDNTSNIKYIISDVNNFYMGNEYIYLLSSVYAGWSNSTACPPNARCMYNPWVPYTNITKLSLKDWSYKWNNLTPGSIYNPWNLWEYDGELIAIAMVYDSKYLPDTTISKFDVDMNLSKYISSVMPGEDFKTARLINDKLYLVTFEQTDPLFVFEAKSLDKLWELVIPWFSTYLHPYSVVGKKQYIIWLWSEVKDGRDAGIKLDLYEIDFGTAKPTIKQKYTQTIWWRWSYSEALYNPRMFVRDSLRNKLLIPITRQDQVCSSASNGYRCDYHTLFDGFKSIGIYLDKGIIQHGAYDYQKYNNKNAWYYYGYGQVRVWYSSDTIYYINPQFADFLKKGTLQLDK